MVSFPSIPFLLLVWILGLFFTLQPTCDLPNLDFHVLVVSVTSIAGIITGESLVGIAVAVPVVVTGNPRAAAVFGHVDLHALGLLALLLTMATLTLSVVGFEAQTTLSCF